MQLLFSRGQLFNKLSRYCVVAKAKIRQQNYLTDLNILA